MRNTALCLSLVAAAVGLVLCWNAPVARAAEEEQEHQAALQGAPVAGQHAPCDMMCCKNMPRMCGAWSHHWSREGHCIALGLVGGALAIRLICNVLLASWIYTDIRKQGQGHGVFVALALLMGFPTAIVYALIRIGDKKA
jgi:hypothetical protein